MESVSTRSAEVYLSSDLYGSEQREKVNFRKWSYISSIS